MRKKEMEKEARFKEKISREIRKAKKGTTKLKITFKRGGIDALDQFCELNENGVIAMSDSCAAIIAAAKEKRYWAHASNRIITIGLGINFNINKRKAKKVLVAAIQDIEAVKKAKKGR